MRRILAAVPVDGALGVTLTVAVYRKIGADISRTRTILSASFGHTVKVTVGVGSTGVPDGGN